MMNEINEVCKKMEKEIENLSEKLSKVTIEVFYWIITERFNENSWNKQS